MHPDKQLRYHHARSCRPYENRSRLSNYKKPILTRHKLMLALTSIIILSSLAAGITALFHDGSKTSPALASEQHQNTPPKPQLPLVDEAALSTELLSIIDARPNLDIGVSIHDLSNNKSYNYGVDEPFIAASVGKLLTACLYLEHVEKGDYTLDDQLGGMTARAHIQKMIAQSDNNAWKLLNDKLTHPALETYAQKNGLTKYSAENNTIRPSDVSQLLAKLYNRKILNEDHTRFLLANMQQDQEEIQFIRKYISPEIGVYHKAGWLSDRAHDTAIVENGDRPYVLVIFTKARYGDYDFTKGQALFSEITTSVQRKMVY